MSVLYGWNLSFERGFVVDFYSQAKRAVQRGSEIDLLHRWEGDPKLKLATSPSPMFIKKEAVSYKSGRNAQGSRRDSLEYIFCLAGLKNKEVAFACLVDEKTQSISKTLFGSLGMCGYCFWETNGFLNKSLKIAEQTGLKVMLGHTHPPGYGPVCSNIRFWPDNPYGEDYLMILWRMYRWPNLISRFHMIMTPREDLIGVFEVKPMGVVVYHPLKYVK